ncbi:glycoside hydrolase family 3 N-terminal domain-containing protein [Acidaminobacterium chupaoyuni]
MKKITAVLLAMCLLGGCHSTAIPETKEKQPSAPQTPAEAPHTPAAPPQTPEPPAAEGLFGAYRGQARTVIAEMSTEDLAAQVCFVRYPEAAGLTAVLDAHPGGLLLFARDFEGLSAEKTQQKIDACQRSSPFPLLIGADEEGGTVCRISANPQLRAARFPSPQQLKAQGGLEAVKADAKEKAALLRGLGVNVNLAPVADVCDENAYMYPRTWGGSAAETAQYVGACVTAAEEAGLGCVVKHFPGYAAQDNTHQKAAVDLRSMQELQSAALPPFQAAIEAKAKAILVSHHQVPALEEGLPASLSPKTMAYLREEMGFEGVIVTDDLSMGALKEWGGESACAEKALAAGADLLIVTDFAGARQAILKALESGALPRARLEEAAERVICWKLWLGLF